MSKAMTMRFEPFEKKNRHPKQNNCQLGSMYVETMIVTYISHLETAAKICCDPWYAPFLTGPPPKDSRRDARACQAKRLKINKEMQTFMKDSKSSRKAAGIPRQNKKNQVCFILGASLRMPCQGKGKLDFLVAK